MGMWNTGYQANMALQTLGLESIEGWRAAVLALLGAGYDPASYYDCFMQGLLYFLPIYITTMVVGLTWEVLFAAVRNHEVNEGFFVTGWLFALIGCGTGCWAIRFENGSVLKGARLSRIFEMDSVRWIGGLGARRAQCGHQQQYRE
jgi:hypothetical protein